MTDPRVSSLALQRRTRMLTNGMARRRNHKELSEFGKLVESWRKRNGLSQAVLANLIGTHQRTYSDWLKKEGMPGAVIQIARLAALMDGDVEGLVTKDASVAPFRDPEFVRDLLARTVSSKIAKRYVESQEGRRTPSDSEANQ